MNKSTKHQNINSKNPISMSKLLQPGIRRPNWICRKTRQVVILVRDKSGSMEDENKAEQATKATQELVRELARPENKNKMDFFNGEKFSLDNLPDVVLTKDDNDTINGKVTSIQHAIKKDDPIQHAETLNKIAGEAEANMLMASKHNEHDDVLLAREHMIDGISFTLAGVRECPNHPIILKLAPLLKSKIKRT